MKAGKKRELDFQEIARLVEANVSVLDLGCGHGVLLEYLRQRKNVHGVGVEIDFNHVLSCVKRSVPVYQGDAEAFLPTLPDGAFDHVIFSRTVEHLTHPDRIIGEALRVGRRVTIGFVNHGYWVNRAAMLCHGRRPINEVTPNRWYHSRPSNPFSIAEFERFCNRRRIAITARVFLRGDWRRRCLFAPNWRAGYAIYDIAR